MLRYLIMNGWTAAEQNHLGTDQSDEQVLMDGRPVRFGNTVGRGVKSDGRRFQQNSTFPKSVLSVKNIYLCS